MSRKKAIVIVMLVVFFVFSPLIWAESLSIEKAVEIALAANPQVLAARVEVEAAQGRTLQFGARPEPQLSASVEGASLPGHGHDGAGTEFSLGIEQLLEYPGKRSLRTEIGRAGESLAAAELERVRLIVAARVKRAYWQAVFARDAAQVLDRSSVRLDLFLDDLQTRYSTGAAAYADVLRARAEKARLRNQIIEQEKDRCLAALELDELLALPAGEPIELLTAMPFTPLTLDLAGIWERVRYSLTSLRIAAIRKERAVAAVKLSGLSRRPDLLAGFSLPNKKANAWGISLGLTLPFLRPGRARGLILETGADMEVSRLANEARERFLRSALERAYASAKAAEEQVQVFERDLLRELEDELRIQLQYFRYGKTEAYALLDLHRTFVLAELEHLRAVLLYNLALADLEVAGEES